MLFNRHEYDREVSRRAKDRPFWWSLVTGALAGVARWAFRSYRRNDVGMPELFDIVIGVVVLMGAEFLRRFQGRATAAYGLYVQTATALDSATAELRTLKQTSDLPRFVFVDSAGAWLRPKFGTAIGTNASPQEENRAVYWALRIRIKNSPNAKTQRSDATNVSATVEFFSKSNSEPDLRITGRWVTKAAATEHIGADETADHVNIPANNVPIRLYIALRPLAASTAFAYAQENLHAYPNGSHPKYALPAAEYRVRVFLSGSQNEQELWFRLHTQVSVTEPLRIEPLE